MKSPSTSERGETTRTALLEAAAQVIAERGYDRAGMADIAGVANRTTGAIQGQFGTKANLAAEAGLWALREHFPRLDTDPCRTDPLGWLFETIEQWFSPTNVTTRKLIGELNVAALATREDIEPIVGMCTAVVERRYAMTRRAFQHAIEAGQIKEGIDVDALSFYTVAIFPAMGQHAEFGLEPPPLSDLIAMLRGCVAAHP